MEHFGLYFRRNSSRLKRDDDYKEEFDHDADFSPDDDDERDEDFVVSRIEERSSKRATRTPKSLTRRASTRTPTTDKKSIKVIIVYR